MPYLVTLTLALAPVAGRAADKAIDKQELLAAIHGGARYASEILLDADGKSRCDYSLLESKWQDYEPAWHTGQLVYGLSRAYEVTQDPQYLKAARKAADWWVGLAITDHPRLRGMLRAIHGDGIDDIIFATVTDGTAGLFRLYRLTGEERYAKVASEAGDWMYANMWEPRQRMFYDAVDPESGRVRKEWSPFWPDKQNQTINDVARPNNEGSLYKDIFHYTKDPKYKTLFLEICESLIEKQGAEGLWMQFTPNNLEKGTIHPRFNLWYAESLLEAYDMTQEKRYLDAALRTLRFYLKLQQTNGAFYYSNNLNGTSDSYSISGSTTSFAGLLWLRMAKYGVGAEFRRSVERAVKWVMENRYPQSHPDRNLAGGFLEIRSKGGSGKIRILHRDLATSFGLRFLTDYYQARY